MANFIPTNFDQSKMVVINYADQLQPGTFEHALHYLFSDKVDLSAFYSQYANDDAGRPAYDPAILLKIILFAYSRGITSSREIQWHCQNNIIFKALSCDSEPHFTTIANFISDYSQEMETVFEEVLLICHEQDLIGNELFAIDGCKMSSDAAKEWSGTFSELEQKRDKLLRQIQHRMEEHRRFDKHETRDEERIRRNEQAIETLNRSYEKIDKHLKTSAPRMGKGRRQKEVKSNITDNESAKMTTGKGTIQGYVGIAAADRKHQIITDAQAFGEGQEHHLLQPIIEKIKVRYQRLGISDDIYSTGTIVTADTGFANESNMQYLHERGINGYVPDNQFRSRDPKFSHQKGKYGKRHQNKKKASNSIPASEFDFDPVNKTCVCPAGENLSFRREAQDGNGNWKQFFEGRLIQCRHCQIKTRCMRNPSSANHRKGSGRQVSFIVEHKRKPTFTDWMKHRVDSAKGKQIYSHRMSVVEPVFGNLGYNKRLNRFSLRGREKVNGQWLLYCLVHNIEKLSRYGQLAA